VEVCLGIGSVRGDVSVKVTNKLITIKNALLYLLKHRRMAELA